MSAVDQHGSNDLSGKPANLPVSEPSANLPKVALMPQVDNGKRLATLKAQLALKGFAVHDVTTGGYFVSKWNLTKFCPALDDLESFARQVGAA